MWITFRPDCLFAALDLGTLAALFAVIGWLVGLCVLDGVIAVRGKGLLDVDLLSDGKALCATD